MRKMKSAFSIKQQMNFIPWTWSCLLYQMLRLCLQTKSSALCHFSKMWKRHEIKLTFEIQLTLQYFSPAVSVQKTGSVRMLESASGGAGVSAESLSTVCLGLSRRDFRWHACKLLDQIPTLDKRKFRQPLLIAVNNLYAKRLVTEQAY